MVQLIKKYKAFIIGYILIIPLFYILHFIGVIIIPEERTYEIIIYGFIWGYIISLPMHHFKYLKQKKKTVFKALGLFVLIVFTLIVDSNMDIPDNPLTIILIMGFWLGIAHLLLPSFISKYWKLIAFLYVPLFLYFLYFRLFNGDLETYLKARESFPFIIVIIPLLILFIVLVIDQWRWVQNLKADKSKTELSLLKSQINPHFFFNTLNNLYALTIKNSKQAPEVILKLSDMMRYTIYEGEKDYVSLRDEIEYLQNYIELHKIRYQKTVDISFIHDIDTSLQIAPLLFIILLENSFKHGIETLTENAFINIELIENKEEISFIILNNFDPNEVSESNGIGLKNLKRRLSLLYKDQHQILVEKTSNTYKTILKITKHA